MAGNRISPSFREGGPVLEQIDFCNNLHHRIPQNEPTAENQKLRPVVAKIFNKKETFVRLSGFSVNIHLYIIQMNIPDTNNTQCCDFLNNPVRKRKGKLSSRLPVVNVGFAQLETRVRRLGSVHCDAFARLERVDSDALYLPHLLARRLPLDRQVGDELLEHDAPVDRS